MKDWDINIYRGVLTGFNEAFIIDGKKKNELVAEDPKSAEIIRPILRGRDIKKYGYDFADLWLINSHNGIKEKGIMPINIDDYPAIKKHLNLFFPQLEKRADKGETPYNLRNCAYMDDFSKQKIIWKIIGNRLAFSIDTDNFIVNNACYILTGQNLEYLVVFLNSKIIKWYSDLTNMNKTGVGDVQVGAQNIVLFPIPILDEKSQSEFKELLIKILSVNEDRNAVCIYESIANKLVNFYFQLNDDEIEFIESQ